MYIIFVRNYKKRLLYLSIIIFLWISMFLLANLFISQRFSYNLTINDQIIFSYPVKYDIENIFVNKNIQKNSIQANYSLRKNLQQKFSTYKSIKGNFSFQYPSAFELKEQDFNGAEILYHIGFKDKTRPIHGFVQVWNMPYSLEDFLNKSKSTSSQSYINFSSKSITVDNNPGFFWDYSVLTEDGRNYKGLEIFWKKNNEMYRISYFVPAKFWNNKESETFWKIVNSFKIN